MRHPRDPIGPYLAAGGFARLVASGLLARGEALDALAEAAGRKGFGVDASGCRTRLAHALDDATEDAGRAGQEAERAVRRDLAPLLAARAPRAALERAAAAANAGVLSPDELRLLLEAAVTDALARGASR
jgi:hypothetical protein